MRKLRKYISKILIMSLVCFFAVSSFGQEAYAKNGFNGKPSSKVGYKPDKKTGGKTKVKAPGTNDYGYRDSKGRVWVPDGKMHGGKGRTRQYPDGSHDHVYDNGNVRVHKSNKTAAGKNWLSLAAGIIALGIAILSPIPGDELIIGGALLGI